MTLGELKAKYGAQFLFAQPHPSKLDVFCKTHGENIHSRSYTNSSGAWGEAVVAGIEKDLLDHLE